MAKKAILVDLGGTLMLPKPSLGLYLSEIGLNPDDPKEAKWNAIYAGLKSGKIRPRFLEESSRGVKRLAEKYALSLFSDGPDEFTRLCLDQLPIKDYFPEELIIPNRAIELGGKQNKLSWNGAAHFVDRKGYDLAAIIDDEVTSLNPSSELLVPFYLKGDYRLEYVESKLIGDRRIFLANDLEQIADHLINN